MEVRNMDETAPKLRFVIVEWARKTGLRQGGAPNGKLLVGERLYAGPRSLRGVLCWAERVSVW